MIEVKIKKLILRSPFGGSSFKNDSKTTQYDLKTTPIDRLKIEKTTQKRLNTTQYDAKTTPIDLLKIEKKTQKRIK